MRQLPPSRSSAGYTPNRLNPLSAALVSDQGQRLTDIQAIQRLFANGENGGYWPADPAYLYEDSAGTTAASVNGVVGLGLSATSLFGPELITNGEFNNGTTGFICPQGTGSLSNTGNTLTLTNSAATTIWWYTSFTTVVGKTYQVKYSVLGMTGSAPQVQVSKCDDSNINGVTVNGGYITASMIPANRSFIFVATVSTTYLGMRLYSAATSATVDSISCREYLSPPSIQSTTANKPYLRRTPVSGKYWLDSNTANGALTVTFSGSLGSACTIATVGAEGVTILENQTVGTTYNITPAFGYNGDVLIINRALTVAEKALVTRVLSRNVPTLGNELVMNGNFDTTISGWSLNTDSSFVDRPSDLSWVNGTLRCAMITVSNPGCNTPVSVVAGQAYFAACSVIPGTSLGRFFFRFGNNKIYNTEIVYVNTPSTPLPGTKLSFAVIATATQTAYVKMAISAAYSPGGEYHDFDNVTFRPIL